MARENASQLKLQNIEFRHGNWFEPLADLTFDIIVSNPPYIAAGDPHLCQGDVRFEPTSALVSGDSGLEDIRYIVAHAKAFLKPRGRLYIEHGYDQQAQVLDIFMTNGFGSIKQHLDLANNPRLTSGLKP